jgi:PPE-repeat protein
MDYGLEPPEVNSGRMYAGFGSGPLMAAAAAYQALAAELGMSGASFGEVVDALASASWLGPSSVAMLSASMPYVTWMLTTAAQCEEAAMGATQGAAAFETAYASVIPPAVIAENRTELATLVATNFMGVNSAAIAANEATYSEFWAQDASTMYGYAGQLTAISGALVPFMPAAPTTDPAGLAAQAAAVGASAGQSAGQASSQVSGAVGNMASMPSGMGGAAGMLGSVPQMMGSIPQALQSLTSPLSGMASSMSSPLSSFGQLLSPLMGMGMFGQGIGAGVGGSVGSLSSSLGSFGVMPGSGQGLGGFTAAMGRASSLPGMGPRLSVPAGWAENARPVTVAAVGQPLEGAAVPNDTTGVAGVPRAGMVPPMGAGSGGSSPMVGTFYRDGGRPARLAPPRVTREMVF